MKRQRTPAAARRRDRERLLLLSLLVLGLLLAAAFPDRLCPYDPEAQDLSAALQAPSRDHPLGTDRHGRDMLSRVIAGAPTSIFSALALVVIVSALGALAGVICGQAGGWTDALVMGLADVCLAFPGLVLALAVSTLLGRGVGNAVAALAATGWPKYARIARSQTLALRDAPYIAAARLAGCTPTAIVCRHILPNIAGPLLAAAVLDVGTMMMELAALSFLGLGAQPPAAEWGSMMSGGRSMLQTYPWTVLAPGGAIFLTVALFHLWGDAVRDWADPSRKHT